MSSDPLEIPAQETLETPLLTEEEAAEASGETAAPAPTEESEAIPQAPIISFVFDNKHWFFLGILVAALCVYRSFTGCLVASGVVETRALEVSMEFSKVRSEIPGTVYIQLGESYNVTVESNPNVIDAVTLSVNNETEELVVGFNRPCVWNALQFNVLIETPVLEEATLMGSGSMAINDDSYGENKTVNALGAGKLTATFAGVHGLKTNLDGPGSIDLFGSADVHSIDIKGSGSVHGFDIVSDEVDAVLYGAGTAEVYALEELQVSILGGGTLLYKGSPNVTQTVHGGGHVKKED